MRVTPDDRRTLGEALALFATRARAAGLSDQQMAEYLLGTSSRWLHAHGVSVPNLHAWVDLHLKRPMPMPLTAAARAPNDFGSARR
jgi:hypothetical protein